MVGAPPAAADQFTLENWMVAPYNVWSFQHLETVLPTTTVDRGTGPVSSLEADTYDLSHFQFVDYAGKKRNLAHFLEDQHFPPLISKGNRGRCSRLCCSGISVPCRHC